MIRLLYMYQPLIRFSIPNSGIYSDKDLLFYCLQYCMTFGLINFSDVHVLYSLPDSDLEPWSFM